MNMPKGRALTFYERERIESCLRVGRSKKWIAESLSRDYSVIKREVKRNSSAHLPYNAEVAQRLANKRAKKTNKRKLDKAENKELKLFVEKKLAQNWSPEQIAGKLKSLKLAVTISHESIYDYIYNGSEKYKQLYSHLRTARKKRQRKFSRKKQGNIIKNRVSIHQRPTSVSLKKDYGHWETDLVEFGRKHKEVLSVKYERKSMLCRLHKLKSKKAEENEESIVETIEFFPPCWFKSLTRDNGSENVKHLETLKDLGVPSFFCDSYSSWQKGGVENLNKLIRQYLPKKCDFAKITDEEIHFIQESLNNRPRKSNNYLSPNEIYASSLERGL